MSSGGSYDPQAVEDRIYQFWESNGHFHAVPDRQKRPYVIDIPLPNVTGALHLGHAINQTLQDMLIRRHRMLGYAAMWMPGTDHAGIATQAVVERKLKEEQNLTRHELGREGLVQKIWEWKEDYGGRILGQLRKMGFSCDWQRTRFTLDDVCARAVYEVFFRWFKDGLIYRGERLVNWDAALQTAVADDEVIYENVKGHFWHYRYPILTAEEVAKIAPGTPLPNDVVAAAVERATREDAQPGADYLAIATTRPETMLGDTAVAVHPSDERYQRIVGRHVLLPLQNRAIPILADALLAKPELGTGCVKVTPGHDPNDYACGLRNNLPMINILTPDGHINDNGGAFQGQSIQDARKQVVADLEALGLVDSVEDYEHSVGHSDRSKTPIEPMLSEQWFLKMGELAESAMDAVRDGRVQFFPGRYAKTMLDWLGEKRDWCISRQLWWGHRIPVWTVTVNVGGNVDGAFFARVKEKTDEVKAQLSEYLTKAGVASDDFVLRDAEPQNVRVCARTELCREALQGLEQFLANFNFHPTRPKRTVPVAEVPLPNFPDTSHAVSELAQTVVKLQQDSDVLDTWFSSALWPFSTLGWPDNYGQNGDADGPTDLDYFYPTSVLVTGRDIITLWVARMIITGLYFLKRVPFQHVHVHPNIQDGQGRRMSKSLGNGVDPLDIIGMYGTDALRFTMAQMASETQDARLPVKPTTTPDGRTVNTSEKFELGRNFCNKLWQAAHGVVLANLNTEENAPADQRYQPRPLSQEDLAIEDRWILSRLAATVAEVDRRYDRYQANEIVNTLYNFFWSDFCDWYIELSKPRLFRRDESGQVSPLHDASANAARQVLAYVLDRTLRLLHPVIPFVTEALWHDLNAQAPQRGIHELDGAEPALIMAAWPDATRMVRDEQVELEISALQDVIRALRDTLARINTTRAASKDPAIGKLPQAVIRADANIAEGLAAQTTVLERLGRCEEVEVGTDVTKPAESATQVLTGVEVYVPLGGLMDLAAERKRLEKERDNLRGHLERLRGKLSNENFVSRAPTAVVEQERARLVDLESRLELLDRNLADLA